MKVEIPVFESLPERIGRLGELAYNLWWTWHPEARTLFRMMDRVLWRRTQHNPIQLLRQIGPGRLRELAEQEDFLDQYDRVLGQLDEYLSTPSTWFAETYPQHNSFRVAYLCAEFAVHSSLPIYSGGLGLLAGDTCKEASDLGIPFVAVGALYPEGYFTQRLEPDGNQEAIYERIRPEETALLPLLKEDGSRLLVSVPVGERRIHTAVWKVQVGRVPIYLLDTDIPENEPWDRDLIARLYGGDSRIRLRQEIVLGMGGIRLLRALDYEPSVVHLNEGHAAFAVLEMLREQLKENLPLAKALEQVRERVVFTTHTPVKAGHDEFPFYMMEEHFRPLWEEMGLSREQFLSLGQPPGGQNFSMTVLALRMARNSNAVSRKHGEVSRGMWQFLFPERKVEEVPIVSITNGVHVPTWLAQPVANLLDPYLGPDWLRRHDDPESWSPVFQIPDEELWETHMRLKQRLMAFIRERARAAWMATGASPGKLVALGTLLNPELLTIGFARRFATYKRATLILRDLARLKSILHDPRYPVQIIFSGKPHPADEPGKMYLRQVFEACISPELGGHVAFIEDYDKHVAHFLVTGVDLWLNNPEPPKEASGTSGQKASLNGIPSFSVLDGWWYEGYNGKNGWAIEGDTDEAAAESLYHLLETEIAPLYYDRDAHGVPRRWVQVMKNAISSTAGPFSTRRMLKEYMTRMYEQSLVYEMSRGG